MPRDLIREAEIQTKPDLSKPSLEGLAWLLRHPEEWLSHRWDFTLRFKQKACGTVGCAVGIGDIQWGDGWEYDPEQKRDLDAAWAPLFLEGAVDHPDAITPLVVASRIDDYLAGRPIRYLVEGDRS